MNKIRFWLVLPLVLALITLLWDWTHPKNTLPAADCPAFEAGEDFKLPSIFLEDLTWTEVQQAVCTGKSSIIIPTGGTEQNGTHMILGKHNYIVRYTAEKIARALGNMLVAPVIAYVPEGSIYPRSGHMQFPGTLTVSDQTFESLLEYTARSLAVNGFKNIFFLGDSGGNQAGQERVARKLDREFSSYGVHVWHVSKYYGDANGQFKWLLEMGLTREQIGMHAGIRDTSELLAVHPEGVRKELTIAKPDAKSGSNGEPARASADFGGKLLELKILAALTQIRSFLASENKA